MGKRKLKGINAKRIPEKKKIKMQKTLDNMSKNRDDDNVILRDVMTAKLKWAKEEREKGIKAIESHNQVVERIKKQVLKLEGIILAYTEVLTPPKQEENKE